MILKDYIKNLQKIVKDNPEYGNLLVVAVKDDEGNGFREIHYTRSLGDFESGDFIQFNVEDQEEFNQEYKINAICIN